MGLFRSMNIYFSCLFGYVHTRRWFSQAAHHIDKCRRARRKQTQGCLQIPTTSPLFHLSLPYLFLTQPYAHPLPVPTTPYRPPCAHSPGVSLENQHNEPHQLLTQPGVQVLKLEPHVLYVLLRVLFVDPSEGAPAGE